jgi:8-amino-7-oxononanoate synthase
MKSPKHISKKLKEREENNLLRRLTVNQNSIDLFSNDYLGFASSKSIYKKANKILEQSKLKNGSSGSRLISGNSLLHQQTEKLIAKFHKSESALIFNSGYDANLGLLSCVPQLGDVILYDELIHASIRDGIRLSSAKAFKFKHNSLTDLETKLTKQTGTVYVVVESVYSMDGDSPELLELTKLCKKHTAFLIVDEAHAIGVIGSKGKGLCNELKIEKELFARVVTYGKAMGCHGAAILGSEELIEYLINFSRPFIYTTATSPHTIATIQASYLKLNDSIRVKKLNKVISNFNKLVTKHNLEGKFTPSKGAIHSLVIGDITKTKKLAEKLAKNNIAAKAILAPTVPKGKERIRFCLHSYNTNKELELLFEVLK